jgi:hypothetical protein
MCDRCDVEATIREDFMQGSKKGVAVLAASSAGGARHCLTVKGRAAACARSKALVTPHAGRPARILSLMRNGVVCCPKELVPVNELRPCVNALREARL